MIAMYLRDSLVYCSADGRHTYTHKHWTRGEEFMNGKERKQEGGTHWCSTVIHVHTYVHSYERGPELAPEQIGP